MNFFIRAIIALFCITFFPCISFVYAISSNDELEIRKIIDTIQISVNASDSTKVLEFVSPNAALNFRESIRNSLDGKQLRYYQSIGSFEEVSPIKIKVTGTYSVDGKEGGKTWNMNGMSNYFIFEKIDNRWMLLESDFSEKISSEYVFAFFKKFLPYLIMGLLLVFLFWLWMIIDVVTRPIPAQYKVVWIFLLFFFHVFAAFIYFFTTRRKYKREEQMKPPVAPTSQYSSNNQPIVLR